MRARKNARATVRLALPAARSTNRTVAAWSANPPSPHFSAASPAYPTDGLIARPAGPPGFIHDQPSV
jgi:hypothetical protein